MAALVGLLAVGRAGRAAPQTPAPPRTVAFAELVERYRQGDLASLSDAARWRSRDVAKATRAARFSDRATRRAALVFTTDLARIVPVPDVADLIDASRSLTETSGDAAEPASAFRHEVVLCQVAGLMRGVEFARARELLETALRTWPDDPELLLARGSLYETALGGRSRQAQGNEPWAQEYESLSLERLAQLALADLQRVLASATPMPEARVRLGRMLTVRQRYLDARPMLERARRDADDAYLRYLASLFLGQLLERTAQDADAEGAYRDAYQQYPAAQAATLSLARLLMVRGAHTEVAALMLAMFEARRASIEVPDPWRLYEFGQLWCIERRLARLRAEIR